MANKKSVALTVFILTCAMGLSACSLGGKKEEDVIVDEMETEVQVGPTEAPEEPAPAEQKNISVTSADGCISIVLPDGTWSTKADQEDLYSFESPDRGSILIEHGKGEEALSTRIIPSTKDLAGTLELGEDGKDYEIQNYMAIEDGGNGIYTYLVKRLEETPAYQYKVIKVLANPSEYYVLSGTVMQEDPAVLAEVQSTMDTFVISDEESSLKALTETPALDGTEGTSATGSESEAAENVPDADEETEQEDEPEENTSLQAAEGGIAPYAENPDNSDNTKTRTIYSNDGSGLARVVTLNADGVWVDENGIQYRFENESDCYDQNDESYYYHGEAADVYFMPIVPEE